MTIGSCPCCGQALPNEASWNPEARRVTTKHGSVVLLGSDRRAAIFNLLWERRGKVGLTRMRIIEIIYADDADGGPEGGAITNTMRRLRLQVAPLGIEIRRGRADGRGYSLVVTDPDSARASIAPRKQKPAGVWPVGRGRWRAQIRQGAGHRHLGYFASEAAAAAAVQRVRADKAV